MNILEERTARERGLIYVMLGLIGLFVLWQFIWVPLSVAKNNAQRAVSTAQNDYAIVQAGLPQIASQKTTGHNVQPFNRSALVTVAATYNIAISRVQPEAEGALKVWFENIPAEPLYTFMTQLTTDYDATLVRVNINRREGGVVSAQITFAGSTS